MATKDAFKSGQRYARQGGDIKDYTPSTNTSKSKAHYAAWVSGYYGEKTQILLQNLKNNQSTQLGV